MPQEYADNYIDNQFDALEAAQSGASVASPLTLTGTDTEVVLTLVPDGPGMALEIKHPEQPFPLVRFDASGYLYLGNGSQEPAATVQGQNSGDIRMTGGGLIVGGDITAGDNSFDGTQGLRLASPDNTEYRVTVANGGTLVVTEIA